MIKGFKPRLYQETIFSKCALKNTLVVLPTGLGKTNIFLMLAAQRLKQYPESKILFLGPTRPLIMQYHDVFVKSLEMPKERFAVFTGQVRPEKRAEEWKKAQVIFTTPQGFENDLLSRRISVAEVSLIGFDEAHRAVGNYSYVWIAKHYMENSRYPRIVGLTASPGSDKQKIEEVCKNLFIEDIESRGNNDADVAPYIKEIEVRKKLVPLPEEFSKLKRYLDLCYNEKIKALKDKGYLNKTRYLNKKDLLALQGQLVSEMRNGSRDFSSMRAISVLAEAMKVSHAIELLESQGISPLKAYIDKLFSQSRTTKVKAVKNLVSDLNFRSASIITDRLFENGIEHPKINALKEIVKEEEYSKIIVFTQYRDTGSKITEELNRIEGINARLFVGQQKKGNTGMSQKEQIVMLEQFRKGEFNTIVMTSVGEEGLDIPSVDIVVFYEPIPSAIRSIQRRGRTGRQDKGKVVMLITKGTRDETYSWASFHKERRMHRVLRSIKKRVANGDISQPELTKYIDSGIEIYVDFREKGSRVMKRLIEKGVSIKLERLENADYQLSARAAVEYKTDEDFVNSLIDQRLLSQLRELKRNFARPIVLVEGGSDIYSIRNVHPNAIRGMIATIVVSYGIPILFTRNAEESASIIYTIARREQDEFGKSFSMHGDKKAMSLKEQQEYVVSSFPGIGPATAKELLRTMGSIKEIVNSDEEGLRKAHNIGKSTAKRLKGLFEKRYPDSENKGP